MTFSTASEQERWNAKFIAGEAQSLQPDPFVIEVCSSLKPGRALDLAGGAGRHALWLAQRGWNATLADVSDEGLAIAGRRAEEAGVTLTLRRESGDETLAWAVDHPLDLIVVVWRLCAISSLLCPRLWLRVVRFSTRHTRRITRVTRTDIRRAQLCTQESWAQRSLVEDGALSGGEWCGELVARSESAPG